MTMSSLFDLAADLGQYHDEAPAFQPEEQRNSKPLLTRTSNSSSHSSSNQDDTLTLLDDTLLAIHHAYHRPQQHQHQHKQNHVQLLPQAAPLLVRAPPRTLSASKSVDQLDRRLGQLTAGTTAATSTSATTALPRTAASTKSQASSSSSSSSSSPPIAAAVTADMGARRALSELNEELIQLPAATVVSSAALKHLQGQLTDKYLTSRLDKLPATPFVLLARRKTQQRIAQLQPQAESQAPPPPPSPPSSLTCHNASSLRDALQLPAQQHEMLQSLLRIPPAHVAKLSQPQQAMVQFARRYDRALSLSESDLQQLPDATRQQLVQQLQKQLQTAQSLLSRRA